MFKVLHNDPFSSHQECMLIGLFDKPEKFTGTLEPLDDYFQGELTELVKLGDVSAKLKSVSVVHSLGRTNMKRLVFVGLGKEKELRFDQLKEAFGIAFKQTKAMKVKSLSVSLDSFCTERLAEVDVAHALSEAYALATYEFAHYKQKSNEPDVEVDTFDVFTHADQSEIKAALFVGDTLGIGTNCARTLVNIPEI
ncbi:M17 family peptidase N-terminal domain-containing protein [Bacillus sp. N9]